MNKEQQQIIGDAYKNYVSTHENFEWTDDFCKKNLKDRGDQWDVLSQEEFINKCKTDSEFSEKWGLRIEERELSYDERLRLVNYDKNRFNSIDEWIDWYNNEPDEFYYMGINYTKETALTDLSVPTKLITITYKDKTIESYE